MSKTRAEIIEEEGHYKECDVYYGSLFCSCPVRWQGYEEEPPLRQSKGRKPSFMVRGRSIFTLWDKIRRKKDDK